MPVSIERLTGEPIIVITITPPLDPNHGHDVGFAKIADILESLSSPVFLIADFSAITLDFGQLISALDRFSHSFGMEMPDGVEAKFIAVTSDYLVKMGLDALEHEQNIRVRVFKTMDAALTFAHKELH
jgi:hypothetical protein